MSETINSILYNPISIILISLVGLWVVIKLMQKFYKKYLTQSKKVSKFIAFFKFTPSTNLDIKKYHQFRQELPRQLKNKITTCQSYFHINLSSNNVLAKHTHYEHFHRQFYPGYKTVGNEKFILDDKYFIYEVTEQSIDHFNALPDRYVRRLYKKIYQKQVPFIILTLNVTTLGELSTEQLSVLSDKVRRQIDVIQKIKKRRLPLYITITGLDSLKYGQAYNHCIDSFRQVLYGVAQNDQDHNWLERYISSLFSMEDKLLQSSDQNYSYLEATVFIDDLSKKLNITKKFINHLQYENKVTITPSVVGIFLDAPDKHFYNILSVTKNKKGKVTHTGKVILSLATLGIAFYLTYNFISAKTEINSVNEDIDLLGISLEEHQISNQVFSKKLQQIEETFDSEIEQSTFSSIFPISVLYNSIKQNIADGIYVSEFLPLMQASNNSYQLAYLLLITHASDFPSLKKIIYQYMDVFVEVSGVSSASIKRYLDYNDTSPNVVLTGQDIQTIPYINTNALYDNFILNLKGLYGDSSLTLQNLNDFYQESYYRFARQAVLQSILTKYYGLLRSKLSDNENNFFQNVIRLLGANDNTNMIEKRLSLISYMQSYQVAMMPKIKNFTELMSEIRQIIKTKSEYTGEKEFISDQNLFTGAMWKEMIVRARINSLIQNYAHSGQMFFTYKTDISEDSSSASVSGNGQMNVSRVNPIYTSSYIQNVIIQDINSYERLLTDMQQQGVNTEAFDSMARETLNNYTTNYIAAYQNLIVNFKYQAHTTAELKVLLHQLTSANSSLVALVRQVDQNTSFNQDLEKYEFIGKISQAFEAFHKIKDFSFSSIKNSSTNQSPLQVYIDILSTFDKTLLLSNDFEDTSSDASLGILGAQALSIYLNNQDSYLTLANAELDKINMPAVQREPFLKIFSIIYNLGMGNVQSYLNNIWSSQLLPLSQLVAQSFPETLSSNTILMPDEMTLLLNPKDGKFWSAFNKDFSKFLIKQQQHWETRPIKYGKQLELDKVLDQVNHFVDLSETLWDKNGHPKPILIEIYALPYENIKVDRQYIQSIYLTIDNQTVIGIDNYPVKQEITYEWWKSNQSSVGYMLKNSNQESSQLGYWSLYKLIKQANGLKSKFNWEFSNNNQGVEISFRLKNFIFPSSGGMNGQ